MFGYVLVRIKLCTSKEGCVFIPKAKFLTLRSLFFFVFFMFLRLLVFPQKFRKKIFFLTFPFPARFTRARNIWTACDCIRS